MASRWAFRFLLWYICILCVQPQNRFLFLYPLHIADICIVGALGLHLISAAQEGRPVVKFGPATITALLLMFFSLCSLYMGAMQTRSEWNSDIDIIFKNCLVLIMVEAMCFNVQRVWAVQTTLLLATLWWIKGGLRLATAGATYSGDRIMGPAVSLIENPNGFAYLLTVMVPLYLYFFQTSKQKWVRIGFLAVALSAVFIILQTGSRTGLLALIAVGVFLIPKYGAQHKSAIVVGAIAIFFFAGALGQLNVERFKSIPDSIRSFLSSDTEEVDPSQMSQDEQSAWERKMKNRHTWALVKDYIVFGVGIQPDDGLVMEKYYYAGGQVHNEILYAGKQMGIVGMGIYLSFLINLLWQGLKVQRSMTGIWPQVADLGWTLKMQGVVVLVGGFFSPVPWNPIYLVLVGCASALASCVAQTTWAENGATPALAPAARPV